MRELLLFIGMLAGLGTIPFGFPGTFIILVCILLYAIATGFNEAVGVGFFVLLCVMTVIAETADNWLTAVGARRYGASTGSIWLSFVGGLLGCITVLPLNGLTTGAMNLQTFSHMAFAFKITTELLVKGVIFALFMGVLGGLAPAIRAASLPISHALREL